MGSGNRPTPEFRREAVRLALASGWTRRENAVLKQERDILRKPRPSSRKREIDDRRLHRSGTSH
jgi:transposase-like protein